MTLDDLAASLAEQFGIGKAQANQQIHAVVQSIGSALQKGERVALPGLGAFSVTTRAARTGRNPQTGATMQIPEKKVVKFSPASALQKTLNP
jgi:DNA-binding protein HU-beta